jgi:hypothetical protein
MDVTTLAELLRETAEHHDHYEKTHRVWQKNLVYQQQWNVNMLRCCAVKKNVDQPRQSSLPFASEPPRRSPNCLLVYQRNL